MNRPGDPEARPGARTDHRTGGDHQHPRERVELDRAALGRLGFETASDIYERSRPGYPEEAVSYLVGRATIRPGTRVLDLAAGTGKFTRQLLPYGAECVAVEPSPSMRSVLSRVGPGASVIAGVSEAIPLADASVDAVVVAQAFHWFDAPVALAEIARVLRPEGVVCLIWNERDETDPLMVEVTNMTRWDRCMPYPAGMDFGPVIDASGHFGPVTRTKFPFVQEVDRKGLVDQVAPRSYVQVLPDDERRSFIEEVTAFAATLEEPISVPHTTDLFCAALVDRGNERSARW